MDMGLSFSGSSPTLIVDHNVLIGAYCDFVAEQDGLDIATQS